LCIKLVIWNKSLLWCTVRETSNIILVLKGVKGHKYDTQRSKVKKVTEGLWISNVFPASTEDVGLTSSALFVFRHYEEYPYMSGTGRPCLPSLKYSVHSSVCCFHDNWPINILETSSVFHIDWYIRMIWHAKIKPCSYDVSEVVNTYEYFHRKVLFTNYAFFSASCLRWIHQANLVACVLCGDHLSFL